ncbi:MAG: ABC transporter substrate-binding protein [Chloroflexota bacterium]|nr:ABC transporter substrate-binding protein [Chloroflexota bacterium]
MQGRNAYGQRRIGRRRLIGQTAAAGMAVAGAGHLGGTRSAARQEAASGILQMGRESEFQPNFNPMQVSTGTQTQICDLIFGRLLKVDTDLNLVPDLAESYEISDDATQFTFTLRDDAVWHDGEPVTVDDVLFTYRLAMRPEAAARQWGKLSQIAGATEFNEGASDEVAGLERVDDQTVRFTLSAPNVAWLFGTALSNSLMWILPEHILGDADPAALDQHPFMLAPEVGSGAYKFIDYVPDQYIQFEANPDFYLGAPKIGQVFLQLAVPTTQLAQLESGQLHLMPRMSPRDGERLADDPALRIEPAPGVGVFQIAVNNERFPDKRVRQAMMYAVDRAALLDVVELGQGRLVNSTVIGPEWATYDDLDDYAYDPERARALLADAAWDGSRTISLTWSQGFQAIELAAPVFQQQLAEVGITVELAPLESAAYLQAVVTEPDFDLAWFGGGSYGMDPDVSSAYYLSTTWTPAGANTTHYANEALDELFIAGRGTPDLKERAAIYHDVALTLNEDVPTLFFWSNNLIWGMSADLAGVRPGPNQYIWWNIQEWSLTGE